MKKNFVSLAEARPDLAKEWNYEKNGNLRPEDVSCGSSKKVRYGGSCLIMCQMIIQLNI